jgi:hypothetical protein
MAKLAGFWAWWGRATSSELFFLGTGDLGDRNAESTYKSSRPVKKTQRKLPHLVHWQQHGCGWQVLWLKLLQGSLLLPDGRSPSQITTDVLGGGGLCWRNLATDPA